MGFKRKLCLLIFVVIPFFLFSGCGDLEPEMQDTRSVVLKMNFNQRSSSRSSQISQAEVSSHKTHLILALPSWENLSSNYKNYYSSFAQELMNPSDNKVSLEIPLNTQIKIFAFLFSEDYTMLQLFSGVREVGYYGESQPFSIGTNTNNLRLNITLQSKGTSTGQNDTNSTVPVIETVTAVTSPTSNSTPNYTFASTEAGAITYGGSCSSGITSAVSGNNTITFTALIDGTYSDCTITVTDYEGNVSNILEIPAFTVATNTPDTTAPTVSLIPATITPSGFAVVQSTETGTAYLVNTDVTVSNLASISGAVDNMSNSVPISNANTNTNLSAAGLVDGTYKAYAVDAAGNLSVPSLDNVTIGGQLVDIDGNVYRTVVIGTQHWMAENLKVTRYRNGVNITYVSNNASWNGLTTGAYGYYGNNTTNRDTYGILYNWHAVDDSRGICPEGWHVPSRTEFDTLSTYLGGDSIAGSKLKEAGTVHWDFPNSGGTNESGFTALPAGSRLYSNGSYYYLGTRSHFWSSESIGSNMRRLKHDSFTFESATFVKNMGFSIRCLED